MDAFCDLRQESNTAQAAADTAALHMEVRHAPLVIVRRIERLEAERRGAQRTIEGYTRNFRNGRGVIVSSDTFPPASGRYREQLDAQAAQLDEQIRYWKSALDKAKAAGTWTPVDRDNIQPGDLVKYGGVWRTVVKVNKKTVTVETDYPWTGKAPLQEITDHRAARQTAERPS